MKNHTFIVSKSCMEMGLRAGAIIFENVDIKKADENLKQRIAAEIKAVGRQHLTNTDIKQLPSIKRLHDIFKKTGVNPNRHPPSNQRLLKTANKKKEFPEINGFVDAYNLISLKSLCSLGAHDVSALSFPVKLDVTTGREAFIPLGQKEPVDVKPGEFAYIDEKSRVICRMDILQAEFSKVTEKTKDVLLIIEGTDIMGKSNFETVFDQALTLIKSQTGAMGKIIAFPEC